MKLFIHPSVEKFLKSLDNNFAAEVLSTIELLETYGKKLCMPHAKPIGGGLWELRITGKYSSRILYGFHKKSIILVVALKKQRMALPPGDVKVARRRLEEYCKL